MFIVGMEDGILPHNRSIESVDEEEMDEERRLCYVGITRAKKRLYLLHASMRSLWGRAEPQVPSRFLEEVPANLLSGTVNRQGRRESVIAATRGMTRAAGTCGPSARRGAGRTQAVRQADGGRSRNKHRAPFTGHRARRRGPRRRAGGQASKSKEEAEAALQFKRRDSVQHPKFGVGTVIEEQDGGRRGRGDGGVSGHRHQTPGGLAGGIEEAMSSGADKPVDSPPWSASTKTIIVSAALVLPGWWSGVSTIITPLVIAAVLAYLLNPLISWLERTAPLRRIYAVLAVYAGLFPVIGGGAVTALGLCGG